MESSQPIIAVITKQTPDLSGCMIVIHTQTLLKRKLASPADGTTALLLNPFGFVLFKGDAVQEFQRPILPGSFSLLASLFKPFLDQRIIFQVVRFSLFLGSRHSFPITKDYSRTQSRICLLASEPPSRGLCAILFDDNGNKGKVHFLLSTLLPLPTGESCGQYPSCLYPSRTIGRHVDHDQEYV